MGSGRRSGRDSRTARADAVPADDANKKTDVLSGGEAARLLFCKLMLQKPNVLVLDEPTNHLDLESINALNIALQRYQGTVLLVSHDHDLIDEVATRIWHFETDHKMTDFKGTYEEYQRRQSAHKSRSIELPGLHSILITGCVCWRNCAAVCEAHGEGSGGLRATIGRVAEFRHDVTEADGNGSACGYLVGAWGDSRPASSGR